jgi:two-component system, OmpR family, alkaline phosphatase synthesis response regulator PhoP
MDYMARERILIVDDEEDILELVSYHLARDGYQLVLAKTGEEALRKAKNEKFDLIVLDLMLPGVDGLEVTKALRADANARSVPIVMLTARGEDADVVTGLELGADDYVTKPFSPRVLSARVKAVLRRRSAEPTDAAARINIHSVEIDPGRRAAMAGGQPLDLTYSEFQLLLVLARRPGWVFTRSQIVDAVHGGDYPVTDRSVDVQVVGLRKKMGAYGNYIETVRGVGYRFKEKA